MKYKKATIGILSALTLIAVPSCLPEGDTSNYPSGNHNQGGPRVTKLNNGNFLVNYAGKTASYNSYGVRMSDTGMSGFERNQCQQAVNDFRNGNSGNSSYGSGGTPVVQPRNDGKIEVRMPSGRVYLYNSSGGLIQKGSGGNYAEQQEAKNAVNTHLREQRGASDV